jgi:hypothetical protein
LILKNPEYNNELKRKLDKVENYYEITYTLYQNGDYPGALSRCISADSMDLKVEMKAKFSFLKALCIGHTADKKEFETALRFVVVNYPKAEVKPRAQDILNMLAGNKLDSLTMGVDTAKLAKTFVFDASKEHYFILVVDPKDAGPQQVLAATSDFNAEFFTSKNLNSNSIPLGKTKQMITVKSFMSAAVAMDYFATFRDNGEVLVDYPPGKIPYFCISKENYILLLKSEKVEEYASFFTKYYSSFAGEAKKNE